MILLLYLVYGKMTRRDCQKSVDERLNWSTVCEVAEFFSRITNLYKWASTLCKTANAF